MCWQESYLNVDPNAIQTAGLAATCNTSRDLGYFLYEVPCLETAVSPESRL